MRSWPNFKTYLIALTAVAICTSGWIPNLYAQSRREGIDPSRFTETQLRQKYDRLRTSMERAEHLKKRGYMPKAIEEAENAVAIAEEEFGMVSFVTINPIFNLVELYGKKRRFDECDALFDKIYKIIDAEGAVAKVYAVGHRLTIGRYYIDWGKFNKAEKTLKVARAIAVQEGWNYRRYLDLIDQELKKIEALKEANPFLYKDKDN